MFRDAEEIGYTFGNGATTICYTANGEASDWMLGERGVYAISPELGTHSRKSEHFFIKSEKALMDVVTQNYPWVEKVFARFFPMIVLSQTSSDAT